MDQTADQTEWGQDAKARYEALVNAVTTAVDAADPIGLLKSGAPPDEYGPEIGTIVPRVSKATDTVEVCRILHEEFRRWFGDDEAGPMEAYEVPAAAIWEAVLSFRQAG